MATGGNQTENESGNRLVSVRTRYSSRRYKVCRNDSADEQHSPSRRHDRHYRVEQYTVCDSTWIGTSGPKLES